MRNRREVDWDKRRTVVALGTFFLGLTAVGNKLIADAWASEPEDDNGAGLVPATAAATVAETSGRKLTWQEITAADRVRFPDTVNQWAEHFWGGLSNAMARAEEQGRLPADISQEELFEELIVAVRAMAVIESQGNPAAVSESGAIGVMQLTPRYHLLRGEKEEILFDPQINIFRGVEFYFGLWLGAYRELGAAASLEDVGALAAARYHGGPGRLADGSDWKCHTVLEAVRFREARRLGNFVAPNICA